MESVFASPEGAVAIPAALIGIIIMALLLVIPLKILISCMIFHKAGYCWAVGLLMLVPIANIIMIFVLAFGDWPVRRELRQLRQSRT